MFQNEKVVETKICKHCSCTFNITDKDLEFYEKISPIFPLSQPFSPSDKGVEKNIPLNGGGTKGGVLSLGNGKIKYLIPTPNFCPQCREQRRMTWRNEKKIYKRKCDFSGVDLVSMYSPDKNLKVFHNKYWWGDSWDGLDYGENPDFSKSLLGQFYKISQKIPRLHRFCYSEDRMENSEYTNCSGDLKNCYLIFGAARDESCMYSTYINDDKDCMDCFMTINSSSCYEGINLDNCFYVFYSINSKDCNNCYNIVDCVGCQDCIGCIGLRNKEFNILNKQYTKEEYFSEKEKIIKNGKCEESFLKYFHTFLIKFPRKYLNGINNHSATGDFIHNSKFVINCYDTNNTEDCKNCTWFTDGKDCMDFFSRGEAELCYEISGGGDNMYHCGFTAKSFGCKNSYYLDLCVYCENCFLCVGLKYKQYCILNKQYTKEAYEKLVPKIIEFMSLPQPSLEREEKIEWGEFFPSSISPFGYNETVANEYYPLESSELSVVSQETDTFKVCKLKTGNGKLKINWSDYEAPFPKVEKIIPASKLPENIAEIPDDILNWAIECEITKKPFRIIAQELEFYRKHNLPIPKRHPDQRHLDRMKLRNPRKLFTRICDKCGKNMQTTYAPERPEIVYCENCYNKEIY